MAEPHSILFYGESGDTKTSQLYNAFKYYHKKSGKRGRLVIAGGGGCLPFTDSGMIRFYWTIGANEIKVDVLNREGVVDVVNVAASSNQGFWTIRKIGQGFWPNYVGGQAIFGAYAECHHKATEMDKVGCYMVEGTSSVCDLWLRGLSKRTENMGFKASYIISEGQMGTEEIISGLQEGHYGIAQRELNNIVVENFETLPIDLLIFTALVSSGKVKRTGESIYGPLGAGQAMTNAIPSWFYDTIHLQGMIVPVQENGSAIQKPIKVAWFQNHPDPQTQINYLAKSRVTPEYYERLLQIWPYGGLMLDYKNGIAKYLEAMDKIRELQQGKISEQEFEEVARRLG